MNEVGKVRDVAAVVLAFNRHPQTNYLRGTLDNLDNALSSKRLHSLQVVSPHRAFVLGEISGSKLSSYATYATGGHPANMNTVSALFAGADTGAKWVLFLEDDIDVIGDFFDSVGAWMDEVATEKVDIYPLGASYPNVEPSAERGVFWKYPTHKFYGTQGVVFRASSVRDIAGYIEDSTFEVEGVEQILADGTRQVVRGSGYDIMMARWHNANRTPWLLTPIPSFVQHTGEMSYLTPRNKPHTFPSWPGRSWSFLNRQVHNVS